MRLDIGGIIPPPRYSVRGRKENVYTSQTLKIRRQVFIASLSTGFVRVRPLCPLRCKKIYDIYHPLDRVQLDMGNVRNGSVRTESDPDVLGMVLDRADGPTKWRGSQDHFS